MSLMVRKAFCPSAWESFVPQKQEQQPRRTDVIPKRIKLDHTE